MLLSAMSTSNNGTMTRARRSRSVMQTDEDTQTAGPSNTQQVEPPKKKQKVLFVLRPWSDIQEWTSDKSPLMEMPLEIWDKIFGVESGLALQDHMAMAGTCKQIRRAYTEDAWRALQSIWFTRGKNVTNHIFSTAGVISDPPENATADPSMWIYREQVAETVNTRTINFTRARSTYKVTEKEIMTLPFELKRNPHGRSAAPMKLFSTARVRALALRVHGGPLGHEAHLKNLAEKAEKAKETRKKNGTVQVRKSLPIAHSAHLCFGFPMAGIAFPEDDLDYDDYD